MKLQFGGNGNPLQCSCLENPRDRGAWSVGCRLWGRTESDTTEATQQQQQAAINNYSIGVNEFMIEQINNQNKNISIQKQTSTQIIYDYIVSKAGIKMEHFILFILFCQYSFDGIYIKYIIFKFYFVLPDSKEESRITFFPTNQNFSLSKLV